MPLLREIVTMANDKTHNLMRAKALECISLVGMSIGKERFREDAHQVLQYMQSLQVCDPPPTPPFPCIFAFPPQPLWDPPPPPITVCCKLYMQCLQVHLNPFNEETATKYSSVCNPKKTQHPERFCAGGVG